MTTFICPRGLNLHISCLQSLLSKSSIATVSRLEKKRGEEVSICVSFGKYRESLWKTPIILYYQRPISHFIIIPMTNFVSVQILYWYNTSNSNGQYCIILQYQCPLSNSSYKGLYCSSLEELLTVSIESILLGQDHSKWSWFYELYRTNLKTLVIYKN